MRPGGVSDARKFAFHIFADAVCIRAVLRLGTTLAGGATAGEALAEAVAHLQLPARQVPVFVSHALAAGFEPPGIFQGSGAAQSVHELRMRGSPGIERFAHHAEGGRDFRLAAALGRKLQHRAAIGGIVKRWAAARTRAQGFGIAGHGTSQDFFNKCWGSRGFVRYCGSSDGAIDWPVRMLFCDCMDL